MFLRLADGCRRNTLMRQFAMFAVAATFGILGLAVSDASARNAPQGARASGPLEAYALNPQPLPPGERRKMRGRSKASKKIIIVSGRHGHKAKRKARRTSHSQ